MRMLVPTEAFLRRQRRIAWTNVVPFAVLAVAVGAYAAGRLLSSAASWLAGLLALGAFWAAFVSESRPVVVTGSLVLLVGLPFLAWSVSHLDHRRRTVARLGLLPAVAAAFQVFRMLR